MKGSWGTVVVCKCVAGLGFLKGAQLPWWTLAVLEMLESYDCHRSTSHNEMGQTMYMLPRAGPKRLGDSSFLRNPEGLRVTPRYELGIVCTLCLCPVFSPLEVKKSTLFLIIEKILDFYRKLNWVFFKE